MAQGSALCVLVSVSRHDLRFYVVLRDRRSRPISRGERPQKDRACGEERKAEPCPTRLAGGLSREIASGAHERLSPKKKSAKSDKSDKSPPSRAQGISVAAAGAWGGSVRLKRPMRLLGESVRPKRPMRPLGESVRPKRLMRPWGGGVRLKRPMRPLG